MRQVNEQAANEQAATRAASSAGDSARAGRALARRAGARVALGALAAIGLSGCTLLSKSDPVEIRMLTPAPEAPEHAAEGAGQPLLRLRPVSGAEHLRQELQVAEGEAHTYVELERLRWGEEPAAYLERALVKELFHSGAYLRAVGADAPELEVELDGFGVLGTRAKPVFRASATLLLHDSNKALIEVSVSASEALPAYEEDPDPAAVAAAAGKALTRVVRAIRALLAKHGKWRSPR